MAAKRKVQAPHARGAGGEGAAKKRPTGGKGKPRKYYAKRTPQGETPPADVRPTWWEPFFKAAGVAGTKTMAAKMVGIEYRAIQNYLRDHPGLLAEFGAEWDMAQGEYVDRLNTEASRRGVQGWLEPVIYKGKLQTQLNRETGQYEVVSVRKFDTRALELAMRMAMPDKFRSAPAGSSPFQPNGPTGAPGNVAPVATVIIMPTGDPFVPPGTNDDEDKKP